VRLTPHHQTEILKTVIGSRNKLFKKRLDRMHCSVRWALMLIVVLFTGGMIFIASWNGNLTYRMLAVPLLTGLALAASKYVIERSMNRAYQLTYQSLQESSKWVQVLPVIFK
jgi:hypothetical protein